MPHTKLFLILKHLKYLKKIFENLTRVDIDEVLDHVEKELLYFDLNEQEEIDKVLNGHMKFCNNLRCVIGDAMNASLYQKLNTRWINFSVLVKHKGFSAQQVSLLKIPDGTSQKIVLDKDVLQQEKTLERNVLHLVCDTVGQGQAVA